MRTKPILRVVFGLCFVVCFMNFIKSFKRVSSAWQMAHGVCLKEKNIDATCHDERKFLEGGFLIGVFEYTCVLMKNDAMSALLDVRTLGIGFALLGSGSVTTAGFLTLTGAAWSAASSALKERSVRKSLHKSEKKFAVAS